MSNPTPAAPAVAVPVSAAKRYRIGLYPSAPAWYVTVAGIVFPKRTQETQVNKDVPGDVMVTNVAGTIQHLTDAQVKAIKAKLPDLMFRDRRNERGEITETVVVDKTMNGFMPQGNEHPVAPHLYLRLEEETIKAPEADLGNILREVEAEVQAGENRALADPRDAEIREKNKALKASGGKVGS